MSDKKEIKVGNKITCPNKILGVKEGIVTKIDLWGLTPETLTPEEHGGITVRVTKIWNENDCWPCVGEDEHFSYYGWEEHLIILEE